MRLFCITMGILAAGDLIGVKDICGRDANVSRGHLSPFPSVWGAAHMGELRTEAAISLVQV